jgi:GNAT superfamily N-acetyltransferase
MLVKASKCSANVLLDAANLVYKREDFRGQCFPLCSNPTEVGKALAASDFWFVLIDNGPIAIVRLETHERSAKVTQLCRNDEASLESVVTGLRRSLRDMKISDFVLRVASAEAEQYAAMGFTRGHTYHRFSRIPGQSNMMPILPLVNITQRELPLLSQLMFAAYAKSSDALSNAESAERLLRAIMSGAKGEYLPNASFASGAIPNLVSACLLTVESPGEVRIEQVFTHPLYRARGLATTEIAASMNRLASTGVKSLTAWDRDGDDVVRRLLTKIGFQQDRTVVELATTV